MKNVSFWLKINRMIMFKMINWWEEMQEFWIYCIEKWKWRMGKVWQTHVWHTHTHTLFFNDKFHAKSDQPHVLYITILSKKKKKIRDQKKKKKKLFKSSFDLFRISLLCVGFVALCSMLIHKTDKRNALFRQHTLINGFTLRAHCKTVHALRLCDLFWLASCFLHSPNAVSTIETRKINCHICHDRHKDRCWCVLLWWWWLLLFLVCRKYRWHDVACFFFSFFLHLPTHQL